MADGEFQRKCITYCRISRFSGVFFHISYGDWRMAEIIFPQFLDDQLASYLVRSSIKFFTNAHNHQRYRHSDDSFSRYWHTTPVHCRVFLIFPQLFELVLTCRRQVFTSEWRPSWIILVVMVGNVFLGALVRRRWLRLAESCVRTFRETPKSNE